MACDQTYALRDDKIKNNKYRANSLLGHHVHGRRITNFRTSLKGEYKESPGTAFSGNGKISKPEAKLAETERLIGQLYAENAFLKKVLSSLETKLREHQKQKEGT